MTTRRLAAILAADVVGFSSMMERNEEGTLARLKALQRDLLEPRVSAHHGRVVKTTGDGFLVEFASPLEAVRCALGVQEDLARNGAPEAPEGPLRLRIGITLGDIIIQDDGDIYGEGVNVATRLEQLAEPGGICVSGKVHDEVEGKIAVPLEDRGEYQVKNISRPVRVFATRPSRGATPAGGTASAFERAAPVRMDHKRRIAAAIRDHLARERISREQFAFKTKLGKSTIEKLLIGLFSERTLAIVESHTGLRLREMLESPAVTEAGTAPSAAAGAEALDRPSLAVLPFTNMSGDPEQEYLADGLTEDLITALARLRWLFVIARNSSFTYKGKAVDVRQVAQELGVRYVLEGSVRVAGGRMRVTTQLIDAETGKHIWAERYDRELRDLFAVQDEITERVVAAVEPHLYLEEGFRAASKPPDSIDAWGLVARAVVMLNKFDRERNMEAQALLRRAIALEPTYARAHAVLGWAIYWATYAGWLPEDRQEAVRKAAGHAQDALQHDATDPWARMVFGLCLSSMGQHERALGELQAALTLNPSFALGHIVFGWALLRAGHFDEALVETGWALRMSPVDSFAGFYTTIHGLALVATRQFEEALPYLRASVAAAEHVGQYHSLISCCGHLGLIEEAQEYIAARNKLGPPVRLSVLRRNLAHFAHRDVFLEGLAKAGVPE